MEIEEEVSNLNIQEMKLADLEEVLAIEAVSFPTPWSKQAFIYEILQNNFSLYLIAKIVDQVVAYGGMWLIMDESHVTNIAVAPNYRHRKIGEQLLRTMIAKALAVGMCKMTLEVRPSNTPARKLYSKLGFQESGLRKNYYSDTNEDAIIMWKYDLTK